MAGHMLPEACSQEAADAMTAPYLKPSSGCCWAEQPEKLDAAQRSAGARLRGQGDEMVPPGRAARRGRDACQRHQLLLGRARVLQPPLVLTPEAGS